MRCAGVEGLLLGTGGCGGGVLLEGVGSAELLAEAFDSAGGVYEFLLAGEEGMADVADIDADFCDGAAGLEGVSARTVGGAEHVTGVNFRFHVNLQQAVERASARRCVNVSRPN
jgi:hypothetical protein